MQGNKNDIICFEKSKYPTFSQLMEKNFDRILQLQQLIVDVQSKLNHEQKEREVDQHGLSTRY